MQCRILAVGQKMPQWCEMGCAEYLSRLQHPFSCALIEIASATRHKSGLVRDYKIQEGDKMLQKITHDDHVIALEVQGKTWSTPQLSEQMQYWQGLGQKIILLIGGPDGLSDSCLARANQRWSLSALTFPHTLARIMVLEQLYRAQSILSNHPYHRA